MTSLSPEQLDEAIVAEAMKREWCKDARSFDEDCKAVAQCAIDLKASGWTPPVDPVLVAARKLAADDVVVNALLVREIMAGAHDDQQKVISRVKAIRHGIDMGRQMEVERKNNE